MVLLLGQRYVIPDYFTHIMPPDINCYFQKWACWKMSSWEAWARILTPPKEDVMFPFDSTLLSCDNICMCNPTVNTLRPRHNGRQFPSDILKYMFLNESVWISISLIFVPKGPINSIPALVQIMAWRRPGDKPLSEPMMVSVLTHKCVTQPQCVKR